MTRPCVTAWAYVTPGAGTPRLASGQVRASTWSNSIRAASVARAWARSRRQAIVQRAAANKGAAFGFRAGTGLETGCMPLAAVRVIATSPGVGAMPGHTVSLDYACVWPAPRRRVQRFPSERQPCVRWKMRPGILSLRPDREAAPSGRLLRARRPRRLWTHGQPTGQV